MKSSSIYIFFSQVPLKLYVDFFFFTKRKADITITSPSKKKKKLKKLLYKTIYETCSNVVLLLLKILIYKETISLQDIHIRNLHLIKFFKKIRIILK